jgi:hypothetical protein
MKESAAADDGKEEALVEAVEQKGDFESDESALNEQVVRIYSEDVVAKLLGPIDFAFSASEGESDDECLN